MFFKEMSIEFHKRSKGNRRHEHVGHKGQEVKSRNAEQKSCLGALFINHLAIISHAYAALFNSKKNSIVIS